MNSHFIMIRSCVPSVVGLGRLCGTGGDWALTPGGLELPVRQGPQYGRFGGPDYPEGAEVPPNRYYSSYGTDYPYIISPPWSSLVAYDLNQGIIKWKVPLRRVPR